jgi:DNA-binding protein H-NS
MAKKAKRGRPPGSKNKVNGSVAKMDVGQLRSYISQLESILAKKVSEQRAYFEGQLAELGGFVSKKASAAYKAVGLDGRKGKRAKAEPKYRSKKDPKLVWSGRGMTAGWLKAEMKEAGKPKEFFAIK